MASKTVRYLLWGQSCIHRLQGHLRQCNATPHIIRGCSSKQSTGQEKSKSYAFRPSPDSTHDWIGPPNRLSNLRPITYHIPEKETGLERRLRNLRQETEIWNHEFWAEQNVTFSKEKDAFISSQLKAKGLTARDEQGRKQTLTSEELSVFYKSFLDRNRRKHVDYNKEWYRRNITITLLMSRVVFNNMWKTIRERSGRRRVKSTPS